MITMITMITMVTFKVSMHLKVYLKTVQLGLFERKSVYV